MFYIEEQKYQKLKKELNKSNDYLTKEYIKKLSKKVVNNGMK